MPEYKILKGKKQGYHTESYLETVNQKPDINTIMYFCGSNEFGFIPLINTRQHVSRFRKGVLNSEFKSIQNNLFKEYFGMVDNVL